MRSHWVKCSLFFLFFLLFFHLYWLLTNSANMGAIQILCLSTEKYQTSFPGICCVDAKEGDCQGCCNNWEVKDVLFTKQENLESRYSIIANTVFVQPQAKIWGCIFTCKYNGPGISPLALWCVDTSELRIRQLNWLTLWNCVTASKQVVVSQAS